MDDTSILDDPWPPDLDPADVPFRVRSVTILHRMGYFDDPTLFDTLTEAEVLSWWNATGRAAADSRASSDKVMP